MQKILLNKIDQENWMFTLYENTNGIWYGDFMYSPSSFVDMSMLIELTDKEKKLAFENRFFLIELSEKIRTNYTIYQSRTLNQKDFEFDWVIKRKLIIDTTTYFLSDYKNIIIEKLSSEPEWKIDSKIKNLADSKNPEEIKLEFKQKIDWLIQNDKNPLICYANDLLNDPISNDKMNSLISGMTNGKFLDSIGLYSIQNPINEMILVYINKISDTKI
ncbi:hypothetical protein [Cellulophaga sp. HaHa_2_1]|uniref:hypothetical protein n=1 Tax=Cellulophaga sp. HaHa_2_1 TaxID=2749994 RepID=UPI001C4FB2DF|nr:hypothetical protein [Cellulophaga sp. HaHa_2_1]QXP52503.1 hypothetical protein H0I24_00840 [Cellulophaga sp. HaHa_2_1]